MQLNDPNPIENKFANICFDAAYEVYSQLGAGLMESVYQECLYVEIKRAGLNVQKEVNLPVVYKGTKLNTNYRIDLLVENKLIIEVKSVETLSGLHRAQLLTYLRLSGLKLGLLINFNTDLLKKDIKRVVNGLR